MMRQTALVNFLRRSSLLRRTNTVRKVMPLVATPWRLALAEMFSTDTNARAWQLRTGETVWMRPGTSDLLSLVEVYRQQLYRLPNRVRDMLDETPIVIDAGANIGLFTLYVCKQHPSVRVKAFEPDPANAEVASKNLAALIEAGRVELCQAAVGTADSELRFATGLGMNSRAAIRGDRCVVVVPQTDLLKQTASAGLLKLDAEGAEWGILRDSRWPTQAPRSVVMEWHSLWADGPEPDAANEILRLVRRAGLTVEAEPFVADPPLVGGFWAWRA